MYGGGGGTDQALNPTLNKVGPTQSRDRDPGHAILLSACRRSYTPPGGALRPHQDGQQDNRGQVGEGETETDRDMEMER